VAFRAGHFSPISPPTRLAALCEVLQQDFLALDLPAARFDGVFANASLFHVSSLDLPRLRRELHRALLKPRGVLFVPLSIPERRAEGSDGLPRADLWTRRWHRLAQMRESTPKGLIVHGGPAAMDCGGIPLHRERHVAYTFRGRQGVRLSPRR
jgi:hypothetical protein